VGSGRAPALKERERLGVRAFWLQEGVIAPEAAALISTKGRPSLGMVMNRCTYKECQRLMGPMATYG
jgi:O-acetylhomoserine (thiol)-lyase